MRYSKNSTQIDLFIDGNNIQTQVAVEVQRETVTITIQDLKLKIEDEHQVEFSKHVFSSINSNTAFSFIVTIYFIICVNPQGYKFQKTFLAMAIVEFVGCYAPETAIYHLFNETFRDRLIFIIIFQVSNF